MISEKLSTPICLKCKHLYSKQDTEFPKFRFSCAAFPNGIPMKILTGEISHTVNVDGDNGIKFEPK